MAKGRTSREPGATDTHERAILARLLATVPDNPDTWDDNTRLRIATLRHRRYFFCPSASELASRPLAHAGRTVDHTNVEVSRKALKSLSQNRPVTLETILELYQTLEAIAHSNSDKVRALTQSARGKPTEPFVLPKKSVIPSIYWVDHYLLREFREHYAIKRSELGQLCFGNQQYSAKFFHRLEKKDDDSEYRITPFTCDAIYLVLENIFQQMPQFRREPFIVMPPKHKFFASGHTAGAGAGHHTVALAIQQGNLMQPLNEVDKQQLSERVLTYVQRYGFAKSTRREN